MKNSNLKLVIAISLGLLGSWLCFADETSIVWDNTEAARLVQSRCITCHSLDYIQMNSGVIKGANWEAEVNKMRKSYGAPINDDEAKQIVNYLAQKFGGEY